MTQTSEDLGLDREPLSQRAARRLRGALAENRIVQSALAQALHLPQQTLSRKVNGTTAFTLDELELVAEVLGVQLDAVLGLGDYAERGIGRCAIRTAERPAAPGGGRAFLPLDGAAVRLERFELPTFCLGADNVVDFPRRTRTAAEAAGTQSRRERHLSVVRPGVAS